MVILDEQIAREERVKLQDRGVKVRHIGHDVRRKSMTDEEIIPLLHRQSLAMFVTCDLGLYRRGLCHPRYALACLDVNKDHVADYTQRLIRHSMFRTKSKRTGCVIRVSPMKISFWRLDNEQEQHLYWND